VLQARIIASGDKRPRGRRPVLVKVLKSKLESRQQQLTKPSAKRSGKSFAGSQTASRSGPPGGAFHATKNHQSRGPHGTSRILMKNPPKLAALSAKRSAFAASRAALDQSASKSDETGLLTVVHKDNNLLVGKKFDANSSSNAERGPVLGLASLTWQPASKRVMDTVCVTDVTTCSGLTVTVRESSVRDGFFLQQQAAVCSSGISA
jgi:CBX family C-terminal motif